ncbi:hypothetical protein PCANC_08671 [Puccinia coronata f. sp. avenae]|uniref:Uncharacterized protein n=1 Tax=Puccinia coronata f. sp. avenae TaxID=200324 RepID=A0A2N5T5Y0_9BASI|nr:hypothetical protein PCANC_08671 [Puccinia coronata f. sp. avenae]
MIGPLLCSHSLEAHPLSLTRPLVSRGISNVNVGLHWNRFTKRASAEESKLEEVYTNVIPELVTDPGVFEERSGNDIKFRSILKQRDKGRDFGATAGKSQRQGSGKKVTWHQDTEDHTMIKTPLNKAYRNL